VHPFGSIHARSAAFTHRSELTTAAAFVAALSQFPNSPPGEPFTADASFAPLSEFGMVTAANLPAGTTSLLDRDDPGWAWTT